MPRIKFLLITPGFCAGCPCMQLRDNYGVCFMGYWGIEEYTRYLDNTKDTKEYDLWRTMFPRPGACVKECGE